MSVVPLPSMSANRMRFGSNWSGRSNHGESSMRRYLAEAAVAEVGPVADVAVADPHQVRQTVAA